MAALALDVDAVRARFSALGRGWALFDGPGGTQVPDSVIDAIAGYLRESNANLGGSFEASVRSDALVAEARLAGAGFLGCAPEEVVFGQNMTTLNFALSRTVGRELRAGDEILATKLDHDANVAPWLELAHDLELNVRLVELRDDTTLDLDDLRSKLSERTRVVAFPLASNAVGTLVDARLVSELAHEVGALAWADAVHFAPHAPIDVAELGVDVLICSPYKFFGPHLGMAFGRAEVLERWRPYKVRPAGDETVGSRFETGTLAHELLAGFVAAVDYVGDVGWDPIRVARAGARRAVPRGTPRRLAPPRPPDDGRPGSDVRGHARRADAGRRCLTTRRAEDRRVGRQLLRRRGDGPARAPGRSRAHRDRPLQHRGRGRPAARSASDEF